MKRLILLCVVMMTICQNVFAYDIRVYVETSDGNTTPVYFDTTFWGTAYVTYYNHVNNNYNYYTGNSSYANTVKPRGNFVIPDSITNDGETYYRVTSIGEHAFDNCTGLISVTIPSTVTSIGYYAFNNCNSLTSVTIHEGVSYIGDYAFNGCSGLSSLTLPSSISQIIGLAFYGCNNLTNVNFNGTVEQWCGIFFGNTLANPIYYAHSIIINNEPIINLVIPESVSEIKNYAFIGCSNLNSISIPSSVINIGSYAFYNCSNLDSVLLFSNTPCAIGLNSFMGIIPQNRRFYIPCGSGMYYYNSWGHDYPFQEPDVEFEFSLLNNDTSQGSANIIQQYGNNISCMDSSIYINASPNHGYHFDHWSNGNTANPDTLYLSGDSTVTAFFEPNIYNVVGIANDSARGTVTGSCSAVYLDSITLTATANYGFHFLYWYDNSSHIFYPENPLKVAAIDNITMTAIFDYNQYTITLSADTSIHGSVIGAGSFNYLSQRTIRANANYGYHFTQWNDGNTDNPRVIVLAKDTSFTAIYERNEYILSFQSADTTKGIVNVVSIPGLYLDTTPYITATALPHYHFTQWSDGSTENPRQFVFNNNNTYIASFDIDVHTVSVNVDNLAHGTVQGGGNFTYGTPATVSATPYSGYQFTHWSDGSTYNPYTFAVLEDKILTAVFMAEGEPWQDTVVVYDTAYVILHDTAYINVYIHDTTYIDVFVHDTTFVPVHDTTYINIHDTTYITLTDTVTNTVYDTITNTVFDTITNTIYDTTIVYSTDTLWLHDTVFVHDTIYIHDTIYVGVDEVETVSAKIYTNNGQIVVDDAERNTVWLYDVNGRILATKQDEHSPLHFDVPASGTYLIKIGNHPARKVVVIR